MCHCVEEKNKLEALVKDVESIKYPTGSMVVTRTWLRRYPVKNVAVWLFEDLDMHQKILHYSNLVITTNIHLIKYKGRPMDKNLWKVSESNHEAILDTIKSRVDLDGSLD